MALKEVPVESIPELRRVENFGRQEMSALAMEMTHTVYPHEEVYGQYVTIEEWIDCPPEDVFDYLAKTENLAEWTYSLRDFTPAGPGGLMVSFDKIGTNTKIYVRTVSHRDAMTVDYHCSWDQGNELWMIYLMRVVPAELVLDKPGSVVLWTNCRHPYYLKNPFPETAPPERKIWVGDLWPFFYAGHALEMDNLKRILEYRYASGQAEPLRAVHA